MFVLSLLSFPTEGDFVLVLLLEEDGTVGVKTFWLVLSFPTEGIEVVLAGDVDVETVGTKELLLDVLSFPTCDTFDLDLEGDRGEVTVGTKESLLDALSFPTEEDLDLDGVVEEDDTVGTKEVEPNFFLDDDEGRIGLLLLLEGGCGFSAAF